MYKVFIDNKAVIIEASSEKELLKKLPDHRLIEAAGGIVELNGAYLFIRRHGLWDIPKGKLDEGESPEIAAIREVEEECGLDSPQIKDYITTTWHTYEHLGKKVLKKNYWYWLVCSESNPKLKPQLEEGITEVSFLTPADFALVKDHTYLSILEVLEVLEKKIVT